VLLAVGLALEARGVLGRLGPGERRALTVAVVGPGAGRLAPLDAALRASRPRAVLVTGVAGGCAPGLVPGDIVVGDPVGCLPGADWRHPDVGLRDRALEALRAAALPHRVGPLVTVERVVSTPADKAGWWATHRAVAVDMESARVLGWAERAGLPALAVRAVADGPVDWLPPELLGSLGTDGRLRAAGVAALLRRPALWGALWGLGRRTRHALMHLGQFLQAFLARPGRP
jgi:hypothetical protein